jgi:site-specific DNA-methyltransferase (adenine-specific)
LKIILLRKEKKKVLEDKLQTVDPTLIKVSNERPRQRKELGEIEKLLESIKNYGQIQPIVVTREMELVAGGRRLAACLMGGLQAKICFSDEVDPMILRELELEENLQRKNLTPAEEVMATAEIHTLKVARFGEPITNSQKGWTQDDTAALIGKSRASITEDLILAAAIQNFPSLAECKTKSDMKKAVRGLEKVNAQIEALSSYTEQVKTNELYSITQADAIDFMKTIPNQSIDLLLADPPYGIDIFENAIGIGGETGGENTATGIKYEDSEEYAKGLLSVLAARSIQFCKPTAHAYVFCAPSYFWWLKEVMEAEGWIVRERPIVWIKRETGQNNYPSYWPSSSYEFILFARRTDSRIVVEGRPDWIQCDPVLPSLRRHQAEKPVALLKELITRVCFPGAQMVDPFMGSGAGIEAALETRIFATGCDKGIESYAATVERLVNWRKNHDAK